MDQLSRLLASKRFQALVFAIVTPAYFYVRDHRDSFSWADLAFVLAGAAYVAWSSYLTQEKVKEELDASKPAE